MVNEVKYSNIVCSAVIFIVCFSFGNMTSSLKLVYIVFAFDHGHMMVGKQWKLVLQKHRVRICCVFCRKYDESLDYHRQALILCPENPSTFSSMGYVYALTGNQWHIIDTLTCNWHFIDTLTGNWHFIDTSNP